VSDRDVPIEDLAQVEQPQPEQSLVLMAAYLTAAENPQTRMIYRSLGLNP
jgi:hypothetical protein